MCGICGWLSMNGEPVDKDIVRKMTQMIVHRGPDDDGFYFDGPAALAQRRLSIIDVAGGHQPLANEDETIWVTYNGEIYNFPELMRELTSRGHHFKTRSDTEVIVHAYEEWGLDCLPHFNGMYAFALWDSRKQKLLLARDPFGVKPLYLLRDSQHLLFASEIKAFFADPSFSPSIDRVALDEYITYQFVPAPRTIFHNVEKLRPGHYLYIGADGVKQGAFVRAVPQPVRKRPERELVVELQEKIRAAVTRQMISDVPVGAMLSGGVDSATVVAIMQETAGRPVKTFTVGFTGNFAKNELEAARRTAKILGTEHYEVVISAQDCLDVFGTTVWHLDEPIATPSALALYWVSQLAAQHVKVVLTGQGADEPWAGYRRYRGEPIGTWYRRMPSSIRHGIVTPLVDQLPRVEVLKRAVRALDLDDPVQRFTNVYKIFTTTQKAQLLQGRLVDERSEEETADPIRYWQQPVAHLDSLAQQLYVETRFSLPDDLLLYGDKMSMAASLEARVPLLDLELMRFVENLPSDLRLKGWAGHKYLYRKAITRWLPEEILQRPKIGFATPMDEWFQSEISGYVRERLTQKGSACAEYFDIRFIATMIDDHAAGKEDYTRHLYSLLMFEEWHQRFFA